ncbi:MAG: S1 RNA-binding domain-containing protein [Acidobacteria bacterium]|nr:S1 RNA-binding domain-containing protein [Acidobacteriota bacterium]
MSSVEFPNNLEASAVPEVVPSPQEESSFGDVLRQFEAEHQSAEGADAALEGVVVSVSDEAIVVNIGRKMEGILKPDTPGLPSDLAPGVTVMVNISGRTDDGYYQLSTIHVKQPKDFTGLQSAFDGKHAIMGVVTEQVKGGLRIQVADGVHAFLPASRSGVREVADLAKLIGQQIECRITKLDVTDEERPDVVVDRRSILEEQAAAAKQAALETLQEGATVQGRVRSITDFGAFVEIAHGIDGLLHVTDMSWQRVDKPSSVLTPGQSIQVKILKLNRETRKISLGMKQLTADPWTEASANLKAGDRVQGKVVRLADFGAFVEIAPGVDGLIHLSEMSWTKRVRKASDVLQLGEEVEAVVLEVKAGDKRISLGLKQALGNPWDAVETKFAPGTVIEAPVTNLAQFGAFVDLGGGIEGMIHVGDITREKRIQHPKDVLSSGQIVKAQVVEVDKEKRRIRLSMKQLEPTTADLFIAEHAVGDFLTGRVVEVHGSNAKIEISEGVHARCKTKEEAPAAQSASASSADVDDLAAMLASRWKGGSSSSSSGAKDGLRPGQIRRFRISAIDTEHRRIDVELAD